MDNIPMEHFRELERQSELGDRLKNLMAHPEWSSFEKEILDKMEWEGYEEFKRTDPSDVNAIIQAQMIGKIVKEVRHRIHVRIIEGDNAKEIIKTSTSDAEEQ